jgi:hypothetical protein
MTKKKTVAMTKKKTAASAQKTKKLQGWSGQRFLLVLVGS